MKYKIVRFYARENHPSNLKVIKTGLTLKEAQAHCNREDTQKKGEWFDGYERQ